MGIKNRDLGTVEHFDGTEMTVRMDCDKTLSPPTRRARTEHNKDWQYHLKMSAEAGSPLACPLPTVLANLDALTFRYALPI
jgi:hypothetical protein